MSFTSRTEVSSNPTNHFVSFQKDIANFIKTELHHHPNIHQHNPSIRNHTLIQKQKINFLQIAELTSCLIQESHYNNTNFPSIYTSCLLYTPKEIQSNTDLQLLMKSCNKFLYRKKEKKKEKTNKSNKPSGTGSCSSRYSHLKYTKPKINISNINIPKKIEINKDTMSVVEKRNNNLNKYLLNVDKENKNCNSNAQYTEDNQSKFNDTKSLLESIIRRNTKFEDQSLQEYLNEEIKNIKKTHPSENNSMMLSLNNSNIIDSSINLDKKTFFLDNKNYRKSNTGRYKHSRPSTPQTTSSRFYDSTKCSCKITSYNKDVEDSLSPNKKNFNLNINILKNKNLNKEKSRKNIEYNSFRKPNNIPRFKDAKSVRSLKSTTLVLTKGTDNMKISDYKNKVNPKKECFQRQKQICPLKPYKDLISNSHSQYYNNLTPRTTKQQRVKMNKSNLNSPKNMLESRNQSFNCKSNCTRTYSSIGFYKRRPSLKRKLENELNKVEMKNSTKEVPLFNIKIDLKSLMKNENYQIDDKCIQGLNSDNAELSFN